LKLEKGGGRRMNEVKFGPIEPSAEEVRDKAITAASEITAFHEWEESFLPSTHSVEGQRAAAFYAGYRAATRFANTGKARIERLEKVNAELLAACKAAWDVFESTTFDENHPGWITERDMMEEAIHAAEEAAE